MSRQVADRFGEVLEASFDEETQTNMRVRVEWRRFDFIVSVRLTDKLSIAN